ncbi:MAG TPA: PEP-CTERM sorting domain-containing protein [Woeseiaceae bacterium]|nr:PEP-CTERM sorting domain-containing protein [Woeseiaceae bacterium]
MRFRSPVLFSLLAMFANGAASAGPILVDPTTAGSNVDADILWQQCLICYVDAELSDGLEGAQGSLGLGDSFTFDFFDVFVGGLIGSALVNVNATLAFAAPSAASNGSGLGGFTSLFFAINAGYLFWDQPDPIDLGDGSYLGVAFENLVVGGLGNRTTVSATVHRYGSLAVSEPGTLALACLGLIGVWAGRRRRLKISPA